MRKYKLYDRQEVVVKEGLDILNKYNMLYLALIMRFGKTPISLSILERQNKDQSILFVTTKSAIKGIHDVIDSFDIKLSDLQIINYESLHKIKDKFDTIIIDEAHKVSAYPKQNKARKILSNLIKSTTQIIWLSGTVNIESSSQLFHQLSLSPFHSFSKYDTFYHWFRGSDYYKKYTDNKRGYGIQGIFKYTGGPRPSVDYSNTINFESKYNPIMIRRDSLDNALEPTIHTIYVSLSSDLSKIYHDIKVSSIAYYKDHVFIADGGASRQSKLLQLCSGSCIDEDSNGVPISNFKVKAIAKHYLGKKVAIWYKYKEHFNLLKTMFNEEDLYQIDSQVTGLDLSHYEEMVVMSMTYSGANMTQMLARLTNSNNESRPKVTFFISRETIEEKAFNTVMEKRDTNRIFLKE